MGNGSDDLGLIMMLTIAVSVFSVLGLSFYSDSINNDMPEFKSESGIIASLWSMSTNFFHYLVFNNNINNPYVTALIFVPLAFMVFILSVRYLRGT